MSYPVRITRAASIDLKNIIQWIAENDSPAKAIHVLDRLTGAVESISRMPNRGSRPRELPSGTGENSRQVFFKPYRVIYEVTETEIILHAIVDGRRNLQMLLLRRITSD